MIDNDDFKRIYRKTGLKPAEWIELQRNNDKSIYDGQYTPYKAEIFSCRCGSVWCPSCARTSKTNERIRDAMTELEWERTRHVILTVNRETTPKDSFDDVRAAKAIPRLMKRLKCPRWIWILEFHRGGYPHWHVLCESPDGKMLGKQRIARAWPYGIVWESYIKNAAHWKAIVGYHRKKGYLAGEQKAHQLELPDYLLKNTAVRKFGRPNKGRRTKEPLVSRETIAKKTRRTRSYEERFAECDTQTSICINDDRWTKINGSLSTTREIFSDNLLKVDYKTFGVPDDTRYAQLLDYIDAFKIQNDENSQSMTPPKSK